MATENEGVPLSTGVSLPSTSMGAVFLSYASEDAAAAERIAVALQSAGIQVWFDREELRGGDTWDRQIRQQIHDCRLFIAMVSSHTEARDEGYFRREWRLAVERAGDMAEDKAFVVPVAIDDTSERSARVPDAFRQVQWTRLPEGRSTPAFLKRVQLLLSPTPAAAPHVVIASGTPPAGTQASRHVGTRSRTKLAIAAVLASAVLVAGGYWAITRVRPKAETPGIPTTASAPNTNAEKSIAVLPFVDLSEKHDQEYFADGMAEEILDLLVKIPGLKVIGRTSSFSFKGKQVDLPSIGKALGVAYIVEGSVRRSTDRVRVTAQLIDARDGSHRWSETFDGNMADVLRLQDEMAVRIAHALNIEFSGDFQLPSRAAINPPEAYDYYLRGLRALEENSAESVEIARAYFQKALGLAAQFAPAAAGIAVTYQSDCANGTRTETSCPQALRSADVALRLDPRNADPYATRAEVLVVFAWDWAGAAEAVDKAARLGGGLYAKYAAARLACATGRLEHAQQLYQEIMTSSPFEPNARFDMGLCVELRSGHFELAESWMRQGLQISPGYASGRYLLGITQLVQQKLDEALASMKQEKIDDGQLAGLSLVYAAMGRKADSDAALDAMQRSGVSFPSDFARTYAFRGESERALNYLQKAYETHDPFIWYIRGDPLLENLARDPRYKAFLRKMNLPEQ